LKRSESPHTANDPEKGAKKGKSAISIEKERKRLFVEIKKRITDVPEKKRKKKQYGEHREREGGIAIVGQQAAGKRQNFLARMQGRRGARVETAPLPL